MGKDRNRADKCCDSKGNTVVSGYREETIITDRNGKRIWGVALVPELGQERYPLVICSHGLGGSYTSYLEYGKYFASMGIAAYCFDFCGGGGKKSDGKNTDMSLMTEVADLMTVINAAKEWSFVDPGNVILLGGSQGGAASAIAAARMPEDINGLILLYPAFHIPEVVRGMFASKEELPENYFFFMMTLGKPYAADVWDYDVYSEIVKYKKPVLLIHGDMDVIVPIAYSQRAVSVYDDVRYRVIKGAGHGFYGDEFEEAKVYISEYMQELGYIPVNGR